MSKVVRVYHVNGENEVFNNVDVTTKFSWTTLQSLEDKVIRTGKGISNYLEILKFACATYSEEYGDTIDEILDEIYVISVDFHINEKVFSIFLIDMNIEEDNNLYDISDLIQEYTNSDEIEIFNGEILSISWLYSRIKVA